MSTARPNTYESYRMGGFMSDMELYKRVEVLRGPAAGTLYGSGVLGGVINFTTKDASDFLEDDQTTRCA
jgi:hemoglobin/transferrin/lactoferrin receptor protein